MTRRFPTAFAILLVNALFTYSFVSPGDCSTKSVSVETVWQKLKEKQDFILIDVRNPNEFEKFRIPGSVNIPLFALKTKTFLKSKPLVLINEGHSYKQLMDECALLSKAGFTVSVLDGGLYQWKRKGGPLEGDVFAQRELNEISPQTFFAGKAHENWIVVDVSKSSLTRPLSPRIIHIPFANNPKDFISKLKSATKDLFEKTAITPSPLAGEGGGEGGFSSSAGGQPPLGNYKEKDFASIIICDEKGKIYEEIERHIQIAGIQNVFYLKGGLEGYKTFEQQQISMRQEKKVRTGKTNRDCTTCP